MPALQLALIVLSVIVVLAIAYKLVQKNNKTSDPETKAEKGIPKRKNNITVVVITLLAGGAFYYFQSPYQQCVRNIPDMKKNNPLLRGYNDSTLKKACKKDNSW